MNRFNPPLAAAISFFLMSAHRVAAEPAESASDLEQVTVYATHPDAASAAAIGGTVIGQPDMQQFGRDTLDRAALLAPGVSVSTVGARNETDVWIRGFDRWRVPLYQDGIPVYLPVDNRIDFGRFTTVDLAQIQIAKGFASVIDGPGALGGSINLVSRTASKPFEAEARAQTQFDSNGVYDGVISDLFVGSRRAHWFAQAAGSFDRQNDFRLSDSFTPGTLQGSGERIGSFHQDYKINLKAGYLADSGSEYSLNYIDQEGRKDNPPPDGTIAASALNQVKYWTWPSWDKRSLYWLSKNVVDDRGSFVKTRVYYDQFYNQLDSFDSIAYATQNLPKSFDSTYDDRAAGGSVEWDEMLAGGADTVRTAAHYRWDEHRETESTRNAPRAPWYQQPWEIATETTASFAVENIFRPAPAWQLIAGGSYDIRHLGGDRQWVASGVKPPFGYTLSYPVADKNALNGEAAAVYAYRDTGEFHLSYADRARFPTLFEMYSTRFGTFRNNPDLQAERSHYVQAGVSDTLAGTRVAANVFLARVDNAITAVPLSATLSENENTGAERREGFEIELSRQLLADLNAGMNYSELTRVVVAGGAVPTDTPSYKVFAFLDWQPASRVSIVPSLDWEGQRWLQSAVNNTIYYRGGNFALLNLMMRYRRSPLLQFEAGVNNLTDRNYLIEDGYHAAGRQYFVGVRLTV
jgi:iron complex outermembrane receptor protein